MKVAKRGGGALRWLRQREPTVLLSVLLVVAAAWGFLELTDAVLEGGTRAFDRWMVRVLRQADDPATPVGPEWLQEMGRDATAFGGVGALTFFTVVIAGYLWLDRRGRTAVFLVVATVSGLLVSTGLKQLIDRPRPDLVPQLSHVATSSFPSGHSMLAAVVYLTLGALLAASTPRRRLKIYALVVAMVLAVSVGVSRVYLGVHYPTDVLAGWMAGLLWALLCWLVARWLQRHRHVETETETENETEAETEVPSESARTPS